MFHFVSQYITALNYSMYCLFYMIPCHFDDGYLSTTPLPIMPGVTIQSTTLDYDDYSSEEYTTIKPVFDVLPAPSELIDPRVGGFYCDHRLVIEPDLMKSCNNGNYFQVSCSSFFYCLYNKFVLYHCPDHYVPDSFTRKCVRGVKKFLPGAKLVGSYKLDVSTEHSIDRLVYCNDTLFNISISSFYPCLDVNIRIKVSCNTYYECDDGRNVLKYCDYGMVFDGSKCVFGVVVYPLNHTIDVLKEDDTYHPLYLSSYAHAEMDELNYGKFSCTNHTYSTHRFDRKPCSGAATIPVDCFNVLMCEGNRFKHYRCMDGYIYSPTHLLCVKGHLDIDLHLSITFEHGVKYTPQSALNYHVKDPKIINSIGSFTSFDIIGKKCGNIQYNAANSAPAIPLPGTTNKFIMCVVIRGIGRYVIATCPPKTEFKFGVCINV